MKTFLSIAWKLLPGLVLLAVAVTCHLAALAFPHHATGWTIAGNLACAAATFSFAVA